MEFLRIKLTQNKAHYRKEETLENKMTYPLPPFSTIIGAIHKACNFKEYHPMKISIQGNYKTLSSQVYTDYTYLNSINNDRGILVKFSNPSLLSNGFIKVAEALKPQGNSFTEEKTIKVFDKKLLNEYKELKSNGDGFGELKKYQTLITSLKRYEILSEVKLIIHIAGEKGLLNTIKSNIYNLKSIGRSEDFVDIIECKIVKNEEVSFPKSSDYSAYINHEKIRNKDVIIKTNSDKIGGTLYYLSKDYQIVKKKRVFNKVKVIYGSFYEIEEEKEDLYWDGEYIINLN